MAESFGDLIKAKLEESGMSQRRLAQSLHMGSSYINYIIRGVNPSARNGKSVPRRDVVARIARTLGIPQDKALTAAGYEPADLEGRYLGFSASDPPPTRDSRDDTDKGELYSIALSAATAAVHGGGLTTQTPVESGRVSIEVPNTIRIELLDAERDLTDDEREIYKAAFLAAYESVKMALAARAGKT